MEHPAPDWLTGIPFAHRGLHDEAVPENSIAAFAAAVAAGYGIELDVRRTADGIPVIAHEDHLLRVTGRDLRIARSTSTALAELRLAETEHAIPVLADVLDVVAGRVPLMVEVKSLGGRVGHTERLVADLLRDYRGPVCVAGFDPRTVGWFREHAPRLLRGQTAGRLEDVPAPGLLKRWLAGLPRLGSTAPHFVAYELSALPTDATDRWRDAGRPLITWTARTRADLDRARELSDNWIVEGEAAVAVAP